VVLKGHGFSRAAKSAKNNGALAPEGTLLPLYHQEKSLRGKEPAEKYRYSSSISKAIWDRGCWGFLAAPDRL
jgi:hypothetical protein